MLAISCKIVEAGCASYTSDMLTYNLRRARFLHAEAEEGADTKDDRGYAVNPWPTGSQSAWGS